MEANPLTIDASVYYHFAGKDLSRWLAIKRQRVSHSTLGEGTILKIIPRQNSQRPPTLWVLFDQPSDSPRRGWTKGRGFSLILISATALGDNQITRLTLPPDLVDAVRAFEQLQREKAEEARKREQEEQQAARQRAAEEARQRELEAEARQTFQWLKEKYQISWYSEESPISQLYKILIELDEKNSLSRADGKWLVRHKLFQPIAIHYEKKGSLASAGKYWRKAGMPGRALHLTADAKHLRNAVILTMRGGAYRDLGQLADAETAAREATALDPQSYYPYNLLGAIYYQRGFPEAGEQYFDRARELGSSPHEEDEGIQSAIKKAGQAEQATIAEYLLRKDSTRYEWARYYLRPSSL